MNRKLLTMLALALALFCATAAQAKRREGPQSVPFKAPPASKATVDTVFFDNFETDTLGWDTMDMSYQTPKWHIDPYQAYAGNSWWCGTSTETEGWASPPGYGDGWAQFLVSPDFDLTTVSADSVVFSMWHYYNLEPATTSDWDCINVWADTTGDTLWNLNNWINITPDTLRFPGSSYSLIYNYPYAWTYTGLSPDAVPIYGWAGSNGGYTQVGFDLTRFKGKHVRLCFIGASDALGSDETYALFFHGLWYMDNLQVDTVSAGGTSGSIFFDDCEGGAGTWKATGKTPKINWNRTTRKAFSGTTSWYCGNEATGKYDWGQSDAFVSPLIDLGPVSNSQPCLLDFKVWPDIPDDGTVGNEYSDFWNIGISIDSGRTWSDNLYPYIIYDVSKTWLDQSSFATLNLANYLGKAIKIRIGFGSDGDTLIGEGLYIDDFIVTGKTRDVLPPASSICLVDNDGGATDLTENSWTKYLESSLASLGYRYSSVVIGTHKTMTPGYLEQFPVVIWNLGANYDYRGSDAYRAITVNDKECIMSYLNSGGKLWMSGQKYFYANGNLLDTTMHPNILSDYLHLAPDNGWVNSRCDSAVGVTGDPIGDGLSDSLMYDRLNGGGNYWTDANMGYTLNPDSANYPVTGFMLTNDGTFNGLRYSDIGLGYKFVYTAFPFEAVSYPYKRDTLAARIIGWLKPNLNGDYLPPAVPQGLILSQSYDTVKCQWNANTEPDVKGYNVYRCLQSGIPTWTRLGTVLHPDTTLADTSVTGGLNYNYAVTAYDTLIPTNESLKSQWSRILVTPWKEGIEGQPVGVIPARFSLEQNQPNPCRGNTEIRFALPQAGQVELGLYNVAGQRVSTLASGSYPAGYHSVRWSGKDGQGQPLSNGVYFYRLEAWGQNGQGRLSQTKRLIIVK